ncbi:MAG: hypothetical protein R3B57_08165 [Phycisphaerales bacterium]
MRLNALQTSLLAIGVGTAAALMARPGAFSSSQGGEPQPKNTEARLYAGYSGYHRAITTHSREAQQWFDQGIQLLYGFNHDEAIRSFHRAAEIDPECAIAWWGIAYAHGLHINNPQMTEEASTKAYDAAQKAMSLVRHASPVEQALIRAVAARYAMPIPEDRAPLDQAYADAMQRAWEAFPDDPDVGALFAESLMDLQPWDLWTHDGEPKGRTLEILATLERVIALDEDHPGANHFYIHAIEASPWPEKGTASAQRLVDLVPGSGHLVHMPSHIFIRTGRYAEASDANERAIAADDKYFAKAPPPDFYSLYHLHNIHFLAYAAMMEGRYETAMHAARQIEERIPEDFLRTYVEFADGFMPTSLHVMIRFGKWEDILKEPEPDSWRLLSRAEWHYARTVALANLKRIDEARDEARKFEDVAGELTDEWYMGNNPAKDVIGVARAMAMGEIAFKDGRPEEAYAILREGVRLEDELVYDEPPGWMQPVRHALGALLLAGGHPQEAEAVYREDLTRHPNNGWSLLGLSQALEAQGKMEEGMKVDEALGEAWSRADVAPRASCYCHPDAG